MKACVFEKYGPPDILKIKDVPRPEPKQDEVLVRTHTTTVIAGDCELSSFNFPLWFWLPLRLYVGFFRPKRVTVAGQELSGTIEAVGRDVTRFKVGDQVFAATGAKFGAHAEYKCIPETDAITLKPTELSYEDAATLPTGGLNALHHIQHAQVKAGEKILIAGAGGNIGSFAVQLAKYYGATVTAIDCAEKLDMLRSIGADDVIDFKTQDFTKSTEKYDVIMDTIGKTPFSLSLKALTRNGRYILVNPRVNQMLRGLWVSATSSKKVLFAFAPYKTDDMDLLAKLVIEGKITPTIDRSYPFQDIIDAYKYIGAKRHKGNVVIKMAGAE